MRKSVAIISVLFILMPDAVLANPANLFLFNREYGTEDTVLDTCITCHISNDSSEFNPYGEDLSNASGTLVERLKIIENEDSDGDGVINITEITTDRTFPGDPTSVPIALTAWGDIKVLFR